MPDSDTSLISADIYQAAYGMWQIRGGCWIKKDTKLGFWINVLRRKLARRGRAGETALGAGGVSAAAQQGHNGDRQQRTTDLGGTYS